MSIFRGCRSWSELRSEQQSCNTISSWCYYLSVSSIGQYAANWYGCHVNPYQCSANYLLPVFIQLAYMPVIFREIWHASVWVLKSRRIFYTEISIRILPENHFDTGCYMILFWKVVYNSVLYCSVWVHIAVKAFWMVICLKYNELWTFL